MPGPELGHEDLVGSSGGEVNGDLGISTDSHGIGLEAAVFCVRADELWNDSNGFGNLPVVLRRIGWPLKTQEVNNDQGN